MASSVFPTAAETEQIILGPESVTWHRASDARLNLVMAYALVLQVAHPTVDAGVHDYSDFERRPFERLLRTIDYVSLLVYGGSDAVVAGRRLRELHRRFRGMRPDGRRYCALEPGAYAWVHAALIEAYVAGHAHFGNPLRGSELERFYEEYRRLGRLIGVRERDLPASWQGFRDYFDTVVNGRLLRTESVDRVLAATKRLGPPPAPVPEILWRGIRMPARSALWLGTVGPMSKDLRRRLEIHWGTTDELRFRTLGLFCRSLTPVMPERLKVTGPAQLRARRTAIARGPLGIQSAAAS
jgi:uncharacterized protein (DUF2236 family)